MALLYFTHMSIISVIIITIISMIITQSPVAQTQFEHSNNKYENGAKIPKIIQLRDQTMHTITNVQLTACKIIKVIT